MKTFKADLTPGAKGGCDIPPAPRPASSRLWIIDLLKLLAANLIVLHHLSAYGPVAQVMAEHCPRFMDWLYRDARIAVQVFLVTGGYLAAAGISGWFAQGEPSPVRAILQRYVRLAMPYLAALALSILGAALARHWMVDDAIPEAPSVSQLLAHALLLHDVLEHDALSAGVWYVAIDFQLFCVMALLAWGARRVVAWRRARVAEWALPVMQGLVISLMVASLFGFNRHDGFDIWAVYFFGSYGLGAAVYWASDTRRPWWCLGALALLVSLALWFDFRERLALALAVALLLGASRILGRSLGEAASWVKGLVRLAPASYALFLVHFPVCLVANAIFFQLDGEGVSEGVIAMMLAWFASWALALVFYRRVELPLALWWRG
jgi:peptidoglycan/LPS O-acetylase OafA/YrhL